MEKIKKREITEAYNAVAKLYAEKYKDEILLKPKVQQFIADFVANIDKDGLICDMGCGPGQVARYVANSLGRKTTGVDLSPKMIAEAVQANPGIEFTCADVFEMDERHQYAGIIGLYFIVNFPSVQLKSLFQKLHGLLQPKGKLLLSFHIGNDELNRLESFWDSGKPCDFFFFKTETVTDALLKAGFKITETRLREPDISVEYSSQRAYVFAEVL